MKSEKAKKSFKEVPKEDWSRDESVALGLSRFHANSEESLLNILRKVERNPQRPEVEDSIANKTSVGKASYVGA